MSVACYISHAIIHRSSYPYKATRRLLSSIFPVESIIIPISIYKIVPTNSAYLVSKYMFNDRLVE